MSFSSTFRSRMNATSTCKGGREGHIAQQSFNRWWSNDLRREQIEIYWRDKGEYEIAEAIFQDVNQGNNAGTSDDKYMITKTETDPQMGVYIRWRDSHWLVFSREYKTVPTHCQVTVKELNRQIKWMIDGQISGDGEGHRARIENRTLYTMGIQTTGNHSWILNANMNMYIQDNAEARTLKIGDRLMMNDGVYRIMFRDSVSNTGVLMFLLEQDFYRPEEDNLELGIANYYSQREEPEVESEGIEIVIRGSNRIKIGETLRYEVDSDINIVKWAVTDTFNVVQVISQDTDHIEIRVAKDFRNVGSVITIIGETEDGSQGFTTVNVVSTF